MIKLTQFDAADYLDNADVQTSYLNEVAKENNPAELIKALDTVARSKGMAKTARSAGITREGLYKALSENGNPSFENVCHILNALGGVFTVVPLVEKKSVSALKPLKQYFGLFLRSGEK